MLIFGEWLTLVKEWLTQAYNKEVGSCTYSSTSTITAKIRLLAVALIFKSANPLKWNCQLDLLILQLKWMGWKKKQPSPMKTPLTPSFITSLMCGIDCVIVWHLRRNFLLSISLFYLIIKESLYLLDSNAWLIIRWLSFLLVYPIFKRRHSESVIWFKSLKLTVDELALSSQCFYFTDWSG